jgi:hypothetical protein
MAQDYQSPYSNTTLTASHFLYEIINVGREVIRVCIINFAFIYQIQFPVYSNYFIIGIKSFDIHLVH